MRKTYIELMEKALSAYTDAHIHRYYNDVRRDGLTEHGFPRLTANIGILIAHGRRRDLLPIFLEMMELCCDMFLRPYVKAANEFSVREIVCCIDELERARAVDGAHIDRWKSKIRKIIPEECYTVLIQDENDQKTNWAIFGAVSEYARYRFGLGENLAFIDRQLSNQFQWLDENGMYRDNPLEINHQPFVYDLVPRGLFAMLLHFGYRGKYYSQIDDCLRRAGLLTLQMQSPNGEIPFGGRSNQFLLTEAWMIVVFEYEARRYAREGNMALAKEFKSAIARALAVTEQWLNKEPIRHIKNKFPVETKYGCERYAYFDKYMITVASNLYAAYVVCDESIPTEVIPDRRSVAFQTTPYFHKLFLKNGGYGVELDTDGDTHYDANGLGRVHREGAPLAICLSCPCPSNPVYTVDPQKPIAASLCSAVPTEGDWSLGAEESASYEIVEHLATPEAASATLHCRFANGRVTEERYTVNGSGVSIAVEGEGEIGYAIPVFSFDGTDSPDVRVEEDRITVSYEGWVCRYVTDGRILDLKRTAANRNGHYRLFVATAQHALHLKIELVTAE